MSADQIILKLQRVRKMKFYTLGIQSSIMSVKLTYEYLTYTINLFQYFLVFNLYRRVKKLEYISENSHTHSYFGE